MVILSLYVLVWEEDGEELLTLTSVQEMIVRVSGGRPNNLVLASVKWPVMVNTHVQPISLLINEISYQRVCGRAKVYQRGYACNWGFYGFKIGKTIDERYVEGLSITYMH